MPLMHWLAHSNPPLDMPQLRDVYGNETLSLAAFSGWLNKSRSLA